MNRISDLPQELVEPAYEVADVITLEALLEAGLAVAAAFKLGTYRGRDRKLVFRPLVEPALRRTICSITHSERALSPAAAALIKSAIHHLHRRTDASGWHVDFAIGDVVCPPNETSPEVRLLQRTTRIVTAPA